MTSVNSALSDLRGLANNAQNLRSNMLKDISNFDREVQDKLRAVNSFTSQKARLDELATSMENNQRRMAELNQRLAHSTDTVMNWRKRQEALEASISNVIRVMLISAAVFFGLMVIIYHTYLDGPWTLDLTSSVLTSRGVDYGK